MPTATNTANPTAPRNSSPAELDLFAAPTSTMSYLMGRHLAALAFVAFFVPAPAFAQEPGSPRRATEPAAPQAADASVGEATVSTDSRPRRRRASRARRRARLRLRASEPGVTFHVGDGSRQEARSATTASYLSSNLVLDPLCTAPCRTRLRRGVHRFALSRGRVGPVDAGNLRITRSGTLRGELQSRRGLRIGGWVTMAVGLVAGVAIGIGGGYAGASDDIGDDHYGFHYGYLGFGAGVLGATMVAGMIMTLMRDRATVEFTPRRRRRRGARSRATRPRPRAQQSVHRL